MKKDNKTKGNFLIYANNKLQKFTKESQVVDIVKVLLQFNHGFELIVPQESSIANRIDEIGKELNLKIQIDPGSDATAIEYFLFGVTGAGLGAAQGASIAAALWQGSVAALTAYQEAGGLVDVVIPGFGTFVAVGIGFGVASGAAVGLLAVKWRIKVNFQKPNGLAIGFYKKNFITVSFQPI
ncbi:MAG: hypothetical protein F6K65_00545 [Moorea sp. SIO3C2]|nr:hypothetical protein [Moorena sp. SIO3C2]